MHNKADYLQGHVGGIPLGINGPNVAGRDPDSVENLLAQVFSQALDNKDALGNMRHALLGPWPEPATDQLSRSIPSNGMIAQLKDTLYKIMEVQRETREHIVALSKGVR